MDFSTVFKKDMAGKYAGLPGFSAGISLGENLTTPLNQQSSGMSGSSLSPYDNNSEIGMLLNYAEKMASPEKREQELKAKLAYDKEQMKQAFPYLMAREIPRQISEGFGNQAAMTILGARSAVDAMNQTLQAYPKMSFASVPYQGPQKYFSQNNQMSSWSGGSSFSGLPSWESSLNTNLPSSLTKTGGGFGSMLGPALGLASAGIGLISGIGQQRTAASIAQAQLAAQNAAFLEGREQNKGALAGSLFNQIFGTGTGADISFGREKEAEKYKRQFLAPFDLALGSEASKRERLAAISPESKERARFENRLAIERATAEKRAMTDAMFGPVSSGYRA